MIKKLSPLYDKIVVERIEIQDEKTNGGIIIPEANKEKKQIGFVVAVGIGRLSPDGMIIPCQVKEGDKVFFAKYAGTEMGDNQIILKEDDILGIVEE